MGLEHAKQTYECKAPEDVPVGSRTFAPPMVGLPDGAFIAQNPAICIHLGQTLGLAPKDAGAAAKAMQLTADSNEGFGEAFGKKGPERINKWMKHFEDNLGNKPYLMGDSLTYVDYSFLFFLNLLQMKLDKGADDVKGVEITPKLKAWLDKMKAEEVVKKVDGLAAFM